MSHQRQIVEGALNAIVHEIYPNSTLHQKTRLRMKLGKVYRKGSKFNCRKCGTAPRGCEKPITVKPKDEI